MFKQSLRRFNRRWLPAAVLAVVVITGALVLRFELRAEGDSPRLITTQDLPEDVQHEVSTVWERYEALTEGRRDSCPEDVSLVLVAEVVGGDARYVFSDRRMEIEIPTSPRRFRDSLAHELAHHLDATCADAHQLRQAWSEAGGLAEDDWRSGPWETRPAELFAETMVEIINGERVRFGRTMPLPDFALELVRAWLSEELL